MQPLIFRILLILFCCGFFQGSAQESIVTFTKADGLTSMQVTTSLIDSKGLVWLGTIYGLNVYTGSKWVPVKQIEDNNSGGFKPLGIVKIIFEDQNKNIWVTTDQGLFFYNRKYWTFFEPEGDKNYSVKDFLQDRSGAVWMTLEYFQNFDDEIGFSMVSGKLQMYKENKWFKFDYDVAGTAPVKLRDPQRYFTAMFQDRKGWIWFGTLEGVFVYNGEKWSKYKKDDLDAKKVFDLIEDRNGDFWAATENGVSQKVSDKWENISKKNGLAYNSVYKLVEDPLGRKWAFSRNDLRFSGLSLNEDKQWKSFDGGEIHLKGEVKELVWHENEVIAFSEEGISRFKNGKWNRFRKEDGLIDKKYSMIKKDRSKNIWLAGDQGFYKYEEGKWHLLLKQEDKWNVEQIYRDRKNRIWIGTNKSGLFVFIEGAWDKYNEENGLADDHISDVFEDRHGNIWVITRKGITKISTNHLNN